MYGKFHYSFFEHANVPLFIIKFTNFTNKIGAAYTLVLGDSEIESGSAVLKNMENGEEYPVTLEDFDEQFANIAITQALAGSLGFLDESDDE